MRQTNNMIEEMRRQSTISAPPVITKPAPTAAAQLQAAKESALEAAYGMIPAGKVSVPAPDADPYGLNKMAEINSGTDRAARHEFKI